jgi:hypothetical protein
LALAGLVEQRSQKRCHPRHATSFH